MRGSLSYGEQGKGAVVGGVMSEMEKNEVMDDAVMRDVGEVAVSNVG